MNPKARGYAALALYNIMCILVGRCDIGVLVVLFILEP